RPGCNAGENRNLEYRSPEPAFRNNLERRLRSSLRDRRGPRRRRRSVLLRGKRLSEEKVATFLGREGWRWLAEPDACLVEAAGLNWTCQGKTDLGRLTEGVKAKHNAPAFLVSVNGDFRFEATFEATFADLYDQVGILAQASEVRWLKVGAELDGRHWLSAVHTHDESDWSREPLGPLPIGLAVERRATSVFCSVHEEGKWRIFRVLYLPGPIEVGPYSCAPKGVGFEALMPSPVLTDV